MGGVVPLGYRVDNRALHVVEEHAAFVRDLFRRYLEIGSVVRLNGILEQEKIRLPIRTDGSGKTTGGGLISRGHLYKILSNPIYLGRLTHKGQVHEGLHDPIVDRETWDEVQRMLAEHAQDRADSRQGSDALLAGKLFDDRGNRMSPSHATKGGRRYRYYVSQAILQGRQQDAGSLSRVAAMEIERRVVEAVRGAAPSDHLERSIGRQSIQRVSRHPGADVAAIGIDAAASASSSCAFDVDARAAVGRVTIRRTTLEIQFAEGMTGDAPDRVLVIPWTPPSPNRRREIIQGEGEQPAAVRPMRTKARGSHRCSPRRPSLARRTDDRFEPHDRVHRRPREEDRTLDPPDDVARFPFPGPRQGGDRRTAAARLRRQASDGPSDDLVGSVVRAWSQGARTDLIKTRSAQPITRGPQVLVRDRRRLPDVRRSLPPSTQPAHLGNGILPPETPNGIPSQTSGKPAKWPPQTVLGDARAVSERTESAGFPRVPETSADISRSSPANMIQFDRSPL
ncbi:MAG: recombinase family protein [Stellaceae bacterium]